jgi:argininosuccinate synthase
MEMLENTMLHVQKHVNGETRMRLFRGNVIALGIYRVFS